MTVGDPRSKAVAFLLPKDAHNWEVVEVREYTDGTQWVAPLGASA